MFSMSFIVKWSRKAWYRICFSSSRVTLCMSNCGDKEQEGGVCENWGVNSAGVLSACPKAPSRRWVSQDTRWAVCRPAQLQAWSLLGRQQMRHSLWFRRQNKISLLIGLTFYQASVINLPHSMYIHIYSAYVSKISIISQETSNSPHVSTSNNTYISKNKFIIF